MEFSFNLLQSHSHLPPLFSSFLPWLFVAQKKLCVCLCGRLCYGDLGKVSSRGINCRIPRTSKRRGADSEKRAREHCCFGSLTGFLSAIFFFFLFCFFLINKEREGKKHSQKGLSNLSLWMCGFTKGLILVKLFGIDTCFDRANIKRLSLLLLGYTYI